MNGEPFCYGSRLTVRQLLELRANGYDLTRILTDHPELRVLGHRRGVRLRGRPPASATRTSSRRTARSPGPGYSRGRGGRPAAQYRVPGVVDQAGSRAADRLRPARWSSSDP